MERKKRKRCSIHDISVELVVKHWSQASWSNDGRMEAAVGILNYVVRPFEN